jgi:sn-glycerol 3-phosphate transport system ATP-binding protein
VVGISVQNLVKEWSTFRAVDDVSFRTEDAEFVALLGPSGCGKSTTLRLIAGLDETTSGTITIDGHDVTGLAPARRNLSMVFQSYALFPHLTVADNILFGLSVRGVPKAEQQQRLTRTADLLGLGHLLGRRPSQMSGGQQQRVALGRALISETPVCLLDEPLSNLDAKLRAGMRSEIRSLQKRLGITMVYVTHDQTEAMSMADKVILLNQGRVEQAGVPSDLYEKPASVFVAQFVGTPPMNILDIAAGQHGVVIAGGERVLAAARARRLARRHSPRARSAGGRGRSRGGPVQRIFRRRHNPGVPHRRAIAPGARSRPARIAERRHGAARLGAGRHALLRQEERGCVATTSSHSRRTERRN